MLCECGNRFPDNSPYCPYYGRKNTMMRSRPDSLNNGTGTYEPEVFEGVYDAPEVKGGCLRKTVVFLLYLALLVGFVVGAGIMIEGDPTGFIRELQEMWSYVDLGRI